MVRLLLVLSLLLASPAWAADVGDVIFSELMIYPGPGTPQQWIELRNTTGDDQDLTGCELHLGGLSTDLGAAVVPADGYAILSRGEVCVTYDADGDCLRAPDGTFATLDLSTDGDLELRCGALIDRVPIDGDVFRASCAAGSTCSVGLPGSAEDATDNDDWSGWCLAPPALASRNASGQPMVSTPWEPGVCRSGVAGCGEGDAAFSELMIDPATTGREWMEITVTGELGCELHGCELWLGPFEAIDSDNVSSALWSRHTIASPTGTLSGRAGERLLLTDGDAVVAGDGGVGSLFADYAYSGINLPVSAPSSDGDSDTWWLHLRCDGQRIDRAPLLWEPFATLCPDGGCSLNTPVDDADANDELTGWCHAPADRTWQDDTGATFTGTPGEPGACLQKGWPGPGDLVLTELMVSPVQVVGAERPEWFELTSTSSDTVFELEGCRLETRREDADGALPSEARSTQDLGTYETKPIVQPGESAVFTRRTCLDGGEAFDGDCELLGQRQWQYETGVSFSNSEKEELSLLCPAGTGAFALVDAAPYSMDYWAVRSGHTLQFDPRGDDPAAANDEPGAWCEASFFQAIEELALPDGRDNYGTPGTTARCEIRDVDPPKSGVGVLCAVTPRGGGLLCFGLLAVFGRRRR